MENLLDYLNTLEILTPEQKLEILNRARLGGDKLLLTIDEASKLSGIGSKTLREMAKRRDFPKIKIGTKTLVARDRLQEWIGKNINKYF